MKFEMPIMNISMFEMENVATEASTVVTNLKNAEDAAANLVADATSAGSAAATIKVTF